MTVRVLHLSTYDTGGAGRAAFSLHRAMVARGVPSTFRRASGTRFPLARRADRQLARLQRSPWRTWRSVGRFSSLDADLINAAPVDIVNLHWVTDGYLSVEEIGRITLPVTWTMHDMWPFTGTEHYASDLLGHARWREGYSRDNRPDNESGIDMDRWTWERKKAAWATRINLLPVSNWLEQTAAASPLVGQWPRMVIPNVIDTDIFTPGSRDEARAGEGLPDCPLIAFTSSAGISDERKGWKHLLEALPEVRRVFPDVRILVIGQSSPADQSRVTDNILWIGPVSSDQRMTALLRSADAIAVPSLMDNLPMTACEAQSAGRPVVGFSVGGLSDTTQHLGTGYLARPEDSQDLARGLIMAIEDSRGLNVWGRNARERALELWSPDRVVRQYEIAYERALN